MIVTPVEHGLDLLRSDLVRSPGIHASDIYGDLFKRLEPKRYDFGDGPPNATLMALGTAWENHLEYLLRANGIKAERPGELISEEGIAYSPDLVVFNGVVRVGEIKLTTMRIADFPDEPTNNFPPKFNKFMAQMMLYAYWLELSHGWLAVMSLYRPFEPVFRTFNIEWNARELKENHSMMMLHAKEMGAL